MLELAEIEQVLNGAISAQDGSDSLAQFPSADGAHGPLHDQIPLDGRVIQSMQYAAGAAVSESRPIEGSESAILLDSINQGPSDLGILDELLGSLVSSTSMTMATSNAEVPLTFLSLSPTAQVVPAGQPAIFELKFLDPEANGVEGWQGEISVDFGDGTSLSTYIPITEVGLGGGLSYYQGEIGFDHRYYCPGTYQVTATLEGELETVTDEALVVVSNANVQTNCFGVNIDIAHGQGGSFVSGAWEWLDGAYTVANLNDTDGDNLADVDDYDVVPGPLDVGVPEVDLMQLAVSRPVDYSGQHGNNKLTLSISGNARLWSESTKGSEITQRQFDPITDPEDTTPRIMIFWVEATDKSSLWKDIEITATYRGEEDEVRATAIWANIEAIKHSIKSANDVFANGSTWADTPSNIKDRIGGLGGTGLRPIAEPLTGARNVILMRFALTPDGIGTMVGVNQAGTADDINFDVTRQIHQRTWIDIEGEVTSLNAKDYPGGDLANDDAFDTDEGLVREADFIYVMDAPGWQSDKAAVGERNLVMRANFWEYVRISIGGTKPFGNTISGSRASGKYLWHARHRLVPDGGLTMDYKRSTGDNVETTENDIGPGHITIGTGP